MTLDEEIEDIIDDEIVEKYGDRVALIKEAILDEIEKIKRCDEEYLYGLEEKDCLINIDNVRKLLGDK